MVVKEQFKLPCGRTTRQEQVSNKVRFVTKPTASHLLMAKAFLIATVIFSNGFACSRSRHTHRESAISHGAIAGNKPRDPRQRG